jgi:hypothetical protein
MNPRSADTKYTGNEPEWRIQPESEQRQSAIIGAFTWYNYHYGKKEAKECVIDWLMRHDRARDAKLFAKVPESTVRNQTGWLCRMNTMGLVLLEHEEVRLDNTISEHLETVRAVKEVVAAAEEVVAKPNIQDRLREKMAEAAGEIEGMYDEMIQVLHAGGKMNADFKPMAVIRGMNVAPQMVGEIADAWKRRVEELEEVAKGKDAQLVEGYSNFGKIQLRSLIKFCETVIADCGSYVQIKKVERKPRAKKPVSKEKLTQKFKYLEEFAELKLKSEPVTKLVDASEAWFYDTKKRKLIHVVADTHVGSFTVKGTGLIGFDATQSQQKTLRKPAEQIKALLAGGLPQMRKFFKDIKATETKFNGRGNENIILLKIR